MSDPPPPPPSVRRLLKPTLFANSPARSQFCTPSHFGRSCWAPQNCIRAPFADRKPLKGLIILHRPKRNSGAALRNFARRFAVRLHSITFRSSGMTVNLIVWPSIGKAVALYSSLYQRFGQGVICIETYRVCLPDIELTLHHAVVCRGCVSEGRSQTRRRDRISVPSAASFWLKIGESGISSLALSPTTRFSTDFVTH